MELNNLEELTESDNTPTIKNEKNEDSFSQNSSSRQRRIKKSVNFETSKEASLDLERIIPDRYTPETDLFDYPPELFDERNLKPDLKIMCNSCKIYIDLSELNDHRLYHEALTILGLKYLPENEEILKEKRISLIKSCQSKYLKKYKDFGTPKAIDWSVKVKKINNSYELIKSYINNTFEANLRLNNENLKLNAYAESRTTTNELIIGIGTCSNQNETHQKYMEDTYHVMESFGENKNLTYIGTFDGHDGPIASEKCSSQLHLALLHDLAKVESLNIEYLKEKFTYDEINHLNKYELIDETDFGENKSEVAKDPSHSELFQKSFKYAYRQMDKLLSRGSGETSQKRWSGAAACTCIIENRKTQNKMNPYEGWIHVSNCGDIEAVVILDTFNNPNGRKYEVLTCLHTFNAFEKDYERVKRRGGKIFETAAGVKKLQGMYNISRALGFYGDKNVKCYLKSVPACESFRIESNYLCMIIATKGLWKSLSYECVAKLVNEIFLSKKKPLINRNDGTVISPSVKAMLNQYYHTENRLKSKLTKSNLIISSNHKIEDKIIDEHPEIEEKNDDSDAEITRRSSLVSVESISTQKIFEDEPLTNYLRPPKGPEFYSANRSRTALAANTTIAEDADISVSNYKTSSDIYPVSSKNPLMNQSHDQSQEMKELKAFEKDYQRPIWQSKSSFEVEHNFDQQYGLIGVPYGVKHDLEITETDVKMTQVTEAELKANYRDMMPDRKEAKRLEISETIAEKLVTCALVAGCTDNITVNCVLFPGCNF